MWENLSDNEKEFFFHMSIDKNLSNKYTQKLQSNSSNNFKYINFENRKIDFESLNEDDIQFLKQCCHDQSIPFIFPDYNKIGGNKSFLCHLLPIYRKDAVYMYFTTKEAREKILTLVTKAVKRNKNEIIKEMTPYMITLGIVMPDSDIIKVISRWYQKINSDEGIFNIDVIQILKNKISITDTNPRCDILESLDEHFEKSRWFSPYFRVVSEILTEQYLSKIIDKINLSGKDK